MPDDFSGIASSTATSSQRRWYLIVRREGFAVQRIPLPLRFVRTGVELDRFIAPGGVAMDFEFIDDSTVLPTGDRAKVATYEFACVTQPFEINDLVPE